MTTICPSRVLLEPYEILQGAMAGVMRHTQNLKNSKQPTYGCPVDQDWQAHINGTLGEMALAKYLGLYWQGKGGIGEPDVAGQMEVRTRSEHWHELIVHPYDKDDRPIWLVTGLNGDYRVHGWIMGNDAKQDRFWKDPAKGRPAFFVPQDQLNRQTRPGRS